MTEPGIEQLLKQAKQYLQSSEQYVREAKTRDQHWHDLHRRYSVTKQKLQIIFAEIQKQLGVIKRLVFSLRHKNTQLLETIERTKLVMEFHLKQLHKVLDLLKSKTVHPALISSVTSGGSSTTSAAARNSASSVTSNSLVVVEKSTTVASNPQAGTSPPTTMEFVAGASPEATYASTTISMTSEKKTLFDFVNIESVTELQKQAENELKEMKQLENLAQSILQQVDEQYKGIVSSSEKLFSNFQEVSNSDTEATSPLSSSSTSSSTSELSDSKSQTSSKVGINDSSLRQISGLALEIASIHDRIQYVITNPVYTSTVDIRDFEKKVGQLPQYILQLEEHIATINQNCSQIEAKYRKFSDFYNNAVQCFRELEKLAPSIPNRVVQIDDVQTMFHTRILNSNALFEEIRDLTIWYTFFLTSYDNLLLEVERRHKIIEQHQIFLEATKKTLNEMFEEEEKKRQQFFEEFGRYLPASLCPAIVESLPRYSLTPPVVKTSLPRLELSEEDIKNINSSIMATAASASSLEQQQFQFLQQHLTGSQQKQNSAER